MDKIANFFGRPGSRPAIHQRAPLLNYSSFVPGSNVHLDDTSDSIHEPGKEDHTVKNVTGDFSKQSLEENVSVMSQSVDSSDEELGTLTVEKNGDIDTSHGFTGLHKGKTDIALDKLVAIAGSQAIFFLMWIILIIWVVIGIVYRAPDNWQVVMQDGQSIQSYIWDTLLMRQQLIGTHEQVVICGVLRSRILTYKDLIARKLAQRNTKNIIEYKSKEITNEEIEKIDFEGNLPVEIWYDKVSSTASKIIGSLPSMIIFWLGIIVWIVCGVKPSNAGNDPPYTGETTGSNPRLMKFSSTWQLYINSATAVVLLVCTIFLQNIRARHDKYSAKFIVDIFETDEKIEYTLRDSCKEFKLENPVVTIPAQRRSILEKLIDFYADVIGTGIGVVIACVAIGAWGGIGHLMDYDDNWWLIIGTYTGLIGFLDGFAIRQVYYRIVDHEETNYEIVAKEDLELFDLLGIECPAFCDGTIPVEREKTLEFKISSFINRTCSSQWSVVVSVAIIVGLIIIASAMRWSTTGQLICNTPTMIIEAFFMIVLLQAHNWADQQRRVQMTALLARRRILLSHITQRF